MVRNALTKSLGRIGVVAALCVACVSPSLAQPGCPSAGVQPVSLSNVGAAGPVGSASNVHLTSQVLAVWTPDNLVSRIRMSGRFEAVIPATYANETRIRFRIGERIFDVTPFTQTTFAGPIDMVDKSFSISPPLPVSALTDIELYETVDDGPGLDGRWTSLCFTYDIQPSVNPDISGTVSSISPAAAPYVNGDQIRITASAVVGSYPTSTGMVLSVDLASIGGSASQPLFDDGTNGDLVGGDGVFSYLTVMGGTTPLSRVITLRVSDAQGRVDTQPLTLAIALGGSSGPPTQFQSLGAPLCAGIADTGVYTIGQVRWYEVVLPAVTTGAQSSTWVDVFTTALSPESYQSTALALFDSAGRRVAFDNTDGPGSYSEMSFGQTTPLHSGGPLGGVGANGRDGALAAGTYWLAVGAAGMTSSTTNWRVVGSSSSGGSIRVQVNAFGNTCQTPIDLSATLTPTSVRVGEWAHVSASLLVGRNPTSTFTAPTSGVFLDATTIGLGVVPLFDDGIHGDGNAGDGVWGADFVIDEVPARTYPLNVSVRDDQGRTASRSVTLTHLKCGQWTPWGASPGVTGIVDCLTEWDPDGPGPQARLLVAGGIFSAPGGASDDFTNLGGWDGSHWIRIGDAINQRVKASAVAADGTLVVGGSFTASGSVQLSRIARRVETAWVPLGAGLNGDVNAILPLPNGHLIVGGSFTLAGSTTVANVARWDGSTWTALGSGLNAAVSVLKIASNGDIIAGGEFTSSGSEPMLRIARWNGAAWSAMGAGFDGPVRALDIVSNGDIFACGEFSNSGTLRVNGIAKWNGAAWLVLGAGLDGSGWSLARDQNGDLIASGYFDLAGGLPADNVARWDGTSWTTLGTGLDIGAWALLRSSEGRLYAGGNFLRAGSLPVKGLSYWDGAAWNTVGDGFNGQVRAWLTLPNGDVIIGGNFSSFDGQSISGVARWDGSAWTQVGSGLEPGVTSLARMPNGDIIAAGGFTRAGDGTPVQRVARWDGVAWRTMGLGISNNVNALAVTPNGLLYAGGNFDGAGDATARNIAVWNGVFWAPVGQGLNDDVWALAVMPNGDLVAGGWFNNTPTPSTNLGNVARWDGTSWSPIGSVAGDVYSLKPLGDGSLLVGGNFSTGSGIPSRAIARWTGTSWTGFGLGVGSPVYAIEQMSDGDIVVAGSFVDSGTESVLRIARWNGTKWTPVGAGLDAPARFLKALPDGGLFVSGDFRSAGGKVSPFFARWDDVAAPAIDEGPEDVSVSIGESCQFVVTVPLGQQVAYAWRRNGQPLTNGVTPWGSSVRRKGWG